MPISIGIAATKTLSKAANRLAKKNERFEGVMNMYRYSNEEQDWYLSQLEAGDIWGIGHRTVSKLSGQGIHTALDVKNISPQHARSTMGLSGERTVRELQGQSCISLRTMGAAKKSICCSRSFASTVHEIRDLREAIATYAARAAQKLRKEREVTSLLQVFIMTNRHRKAEPQYRNSITVPLSSPSNETHAIVSHALSGLEQIYRAGYGYKRCGVTLINLEPEESYQLRIITEEKQAHIKKVGSTIDAIAKRWGKEAVYDRGARKKSSAGKTYAAKMYQNDSRRCGMSCWRCGRSVGVRSERKEAETCWKYKLRRFLF